MKKILLLCGLFYSMGAFAQNPQLFDTTWYLENIDIQGTVYPAPSNSEVMNVSLNFYTNDIRIETNVCNTAGGEVTFSPTEENFDIESLGQTLIVCNDFDNEVFENLYFKDFLNIDFNSDNPYFYEITTGIGDSKQLVLTSAAGNTATYNNAILGVSEQNLETILLYPNPVVSTVRITTQSNTLVTEVTIFNINGQQILQNEFEGGTRSVALDLTRLQSGLYFAQIKDSNGRSQVQRLVKK